MMCINISGPPGSLLICLSLTVSADNWRSMKVDFNKAEVREVLLVSMLCSCQHLISFHFRIHRAVLDEGPWVVSKTLLTKGQKKRHSISKLLSIFFCG